MYVRGEFHGDIAELKDVILAVQDYAAADESVCDVRCLHDALEYLHDILDADITE